MGAGYPKRVMGMLEEWHKGAVGPKGCETCSSACCSHPGFAVLENVVLIYERYKKGLLVREDYEFPKGMSWVEFVGTYFVIWGFPTGRWPFKKNITCFFPKTLSSNNHLINIPSVGGFFRTRSQLFKENTWLNKGCVFLNKKVEEWPHDDKDTSRHCILHDPESDTHMTAKPIDCVFYVCSEAIRAKTPKREFSGEWFRALAVSYPDSLERYKKIVAEEKKNREEQTKRV